MNEYSRRIAWTVIVSLIVTILPSLSGAQTAWPDRTGKPGVSLEAYKVAVKQSEFFSSVASVVYLSGRFRMLESVDFVAEIPVTYSGFTGLWQRAPNFYYDSTYWWQPAEKNVIVGNIYMGVDIGSSDGGVTWDIGFRLPLASKSSPYTSMIGTAASTDRWGAFIPETWTLSTALGQRKVTSSGFAYQWRGGLLMQRSSGYGASTEFYFQYGGRIGYQDSLFSMLIGLRGLYWDTSDDEDDIGRLTMHSLEGILSISLGHFRPGFRFLWPLDQDQTAIYDKSYGLTVAYDFH